MKIKELAAAGASGLFRVDEETQLRAVEQVAGSAGMLFRVLDGRSMRTLDGVFAEFARQLEFPNYFGENWAALDECITDLEWLDGTGYCIAIIHPDQIFAAAELDQSATLAKILVNAVREWSRPVEEGEAWDRPGRLFCVVFVTDQPSFGGYDVAPLRE